MAAPIYLQIKDQMIEEIQQLSANAPILSERDLAVKYNASRMTVRKAVNELVDEGYLYRDSNKGTFVADERLHKRNTSVDPFAEERPIKYKILYFDIKAPSSKDVQDRLFISSEESVLRIVRVAMFEERPQSIEEIYFPRLSIPDEDLGNFKKLLDFNSYIAHGSLSQTFVPIIVPPQYAHLLKLKINTPIILVENVITSKNGKPLLYMKVFNNPNEKVIEMTL